MSAASPRAADDSDTISQRIAELRTERGAGMYRICSCTWQYDPEGLATRAWAADCLVHTNQQKDANASRPRANEKKMAR